MTLQALSNRTVYTSQWDAREPNAMAHINLTREADAVLVAPASADFIAKLVHGRADDLLALLCLARPIERCPLLVAPAMNREMWAHPATQRNLAQLLADGTTVLGPGSGDQACGETGDGRMLEPVELLEELVAFFQPKRLAGQRVLVTAGPTFEPIDPVRGLTNRSSGKMGFAIARAAARGRRRRDPRRRPGALRRRAACAARRDDRASRCTMRRSPRRRRATSSSPPRRSPTGAPPASPASKMKKGARPDGADVRPGREPGHPGRGRAPRRRAVLRRLRRREPGPGRRQRAREARAQEGRPGVANLGPATFGRDDNTLTLVDARGELALPRAGKLELARRLVAEIAARLPRA